MSTVPPPLPVSGVLNGWVMRLVSSSGTAAPQPGGGTYSPTFVQPGAIGNRAQVTFAQSVNDSSNNPAGEGLYLSRFAFKPGIHQPRNPIWQVVRTGNPLTGGTFSATIGPAVVNGSGQVAFAADYTNGDPSVTSSGIFRYYAAPGQTSTQVLAGDPLPGGATFLSASGGVSFSNQGAVAFSAFSDLATAGTGLSGANQGTGVYVVGARKNVTKVAAPGDSAPIPKGTNPTPSTTFDYAASPSINDLSQVAFVGHQTNGNFPVYTDPANPNRLLGGNLYFVRPRLSPALIVWEGENVGTANGGAVLSYATDPIANNSSQVLFHGAIAGTTSHGVYLYSPNNNLNNGLTKIAAPGDVMPDGSTLIDVATGTGSMGFNDKGDAAFLATTSTGQAIYLARGGKITLVAKTGDVIPALGLGSITSFAQPRHTGGPIINADRQILFAAQMSSGSNSLFAATTYKSLVAGSK